MRGREARHLSYCMQPSQPRVGTGICLHYGTGNMGNSSGKANSSYCPQRGSPEVEMALSQCQPSLPSPLGLLPCSSHESAAPWALPPL